MADKNTYFQSKQKFVNKPPEEVWLQVDEIPDEGLTLTIKAIKDVNMKVNKEGEKALRPLFYFEETEKIFACRNFTLFNAVVTVTGEENTENWVGKKITFIVVPETNSNTKKVVNTIKIKIPRELVK